MKLHPHTPPSHDTVATVAATTTAWLVVPTMLVAIITLVIAPFGASAQSPSSTISFQGYLTNLAGVPFDGAKDITISLHDSLTAGSSVWSRAYISVSVDSGVFNLALTEGTPDMTTVAFTQQLFVQVELPSDGETISPRTPMTSAPYAQSLRNLRVKPETSSGPNMIGGSSVNSAGASVVGATIAGGGEKGGGTIPLPRPNSVTANYGSIGGGLSNTAGGKQSTVSGGETNVASGAASTIGGGSGNAASATGATVAGGGGNTANGFNTTVGGGDSNTAGPAQGATVAGGTNNTASGGFSTILGGTDHTASGDFSTIAGGRSNEASGAYSFAAGRRAKAKSNGSFVWADQTNADFATTGEDQFIIRAGGGVGIGTNNPGAPLHVAGMVRVDRVVYNTPRIHFYAVPGGTAIPQHDVSGIEWRVLGTAGYYVGGSANTVYLPVIVPDGAYLVGFYCQINDEANPENLRCTFCRQAFTSTSCSVVNSVTSSGAPGVTKISTGLGFNADYSNEAYMIQVTNLKGAGSDWSVLTDDLQILRAGVEYRLDLAP